MAKAHFFKENRTLPNGVIILSENIKMPNGKNYNTIWSTYWDIILQKSALLKEESKLIRRDWIWHSFDKNDNCILAIGDDKVLEYVNDPEIIKSMMDVYYIT